MFYFTCNESKIYGNFTFWNKLQEKNELFHNILIYWAAPVCVCVCVCINTYVCMHVYTIYIKKNIYIYIRGVNINALTHVINLKILTR